MGWKVKRAERVNVGALNLAGTILDELRSVTQGMQVEDLRYSSKYNGYSKSQIKDMVRIARQQLQLFSNELDAEEEWVNDEIRNNDSK